MSRAFRHRDERTSVDEELLSVLRGVGPQSIEQVCAMTGMDWPRVFLAVDRLSRCGTIALHRSGRGQYHISLPRAA
ncbi:hypothetical protein [Candidatus Nitrospira bockiana]